MNSKILAALRVMTITTNPALDMTVRVSGLETGSVNRLEDTRADAGGKGVNVAIRLADYGCSVVATGFLGRDNPQIFEHTFTQKGVHDAFVRVAGQTRTNVKIMDTQTNQTTDLNAVGIEPTSEDIQHLLNRIKTLSMGSQWCVIGGQLQAGLPEDLYATMIAHIRTSATQGLDLVVEPPKAEFNEEQVGDSTLTRNRLPMILVDSSGAALAHALRAGANVVKPNIHELAELLGEPLDETSPIHEVLHAAQRLLNEDTTMVVVSMGAHGALFVTQAQSLLARPPAVSVLSTVGAGDAMVAGIVAGLGQGMDLAACARLATAFSINAITHLHRDLVSSTQLEQWQAQVKIEYLNEHIAS